jgi:F-type H+-transporting ATPase subunit gamma
MAGLKEIRVRIASVNSTKQITSAMKMVSAAKLRRAQDAITKMRPYAQKLREILDNVSSSLDSSEGNAFSANRPVKNVLIVAINSNRGLCGGFNSSVVKAARQLITTKYADQNIAGNVKMLCIGRKGHDYFKNNGYKIYANHSEIFDNIQFSSVATVAESIMAAFTKKEFDKVEIVYNQFKNAAVQRLMNEPYLPVSPSPALPERKGDLSKKKATDYIFEPSKEYIVKDLIPRSLKVQLFKAILDSNASEHGARMTAMHKATDNATDMVKQLKLHYNKARQASITKEILEIVGGAEALNG